jgi:hypothetical protein
VLPFPVAAPLRFAPDASLLPAIAVALAGGDVHRLLLVHHLRR